VQAFDTNVLVRLVLGGDPAQAALAAHCWSDALRTGGVFLPVVVLVELVWVLAQVARPDASAASGWTATCAARPNGRPAA
jgi:predicted nucleic-acid-binding protein